MRLAWVMTTADRRPGTNYVSQSLRPLLEEGQRVHLFPTDPDVAWLGDVLHQDVEVHGPTRRLTRIENGAAAMSWPHPDAEWVVHLEDDVRPCEDVVGSVSRWIAQYGAKGRLLLLWSRDTYTAVHRGSCARHPRDRAFGAVAFAMRSEDARAFGRWTAEHGPSWRDGLLRLRGFDKMLKQWHQEVYPTTPILAALPSLFQHIGKDSSLRHLPHQPPPGQLITSPTFTGRAYV